MTDTITSQNIDYSTWVRCMRRNMLRFEFCLILFYFQLLLGFVKVIWIMSWADGANKLMYTVMFLCCVNIVKSVLLSR
jgi:hypothetical protein